MLFLCSRNCLRSPAAECVFAAWPVLGTDSAGLADDADTLLSAEQLDSAELILAMETPHCHRLPARQRERLCGRHLTVLGIPDDYGYMQPALVALLLKKAGPRLR